MPIELNIQRPAAGDSLVLGCLPLMVAILLMCLLPLAMYDVARTAMLKLGLDSTVAGLVVISIFIGSLIHLPVMELSEDKLEAAHVIDLEAQARDRQYHRVASKTLLAVNVGGCVVPVLLGLLQILRLFNIGASAIGIALMVSLINIAACYRLARPVPGIGIMMPGFVPPLVSVIATWAFLFDASPDQRAATAFVAGVAGPVIGADLLHLKDVIKLPVRMVSIGGAGTFDGIVLSGVLAAVLA